MNKRILAALLIAATLTNTVSIEASAETVRTETVVQEYMSPATKVWDGASALKKNTYYTIDKNITIKSNITIPSGCKITVKDKAKVSVGKGATLTINGTLIVKGQLSVTGNLVLNKGKTLQNNGVVNFGKGNVTINGKYIAAKGSKTSGEPKLKIGKSAVIALNGTNASKALDKAYIDIAEINSIPVYFKEAEANVTKTILTADYFIGSCMVTLEYRFVKGNVNSIQLKLSEENLVILDKDLMTYKNLSDFIYLLTGTRVKENKLKTSKSGYYKVYSITLSDEYVKEYSGMSIEQIKFAIELTNSGKGSQNMAEYAGCMSGASIKEAAKVAQKTDSKASAITAVNNKDMYVTVEKADKPYSIYLYANEDTDVTYQIFARKTEATGTIYAGVKFRGWGNGLTNKSYDKYENLLTIKDTLNDVYKTSRLDECDKVEQFEVKNIGKQVLSKPENLKYTYKLTPSTIHLEAGQCYEIVVTSSDAKDKIGLQFKSSVDGAIGEPTFDRNTLLPQDMQDMLKKSAFGVETVSENSDNLTHILVEVAVDKKPVVIYGVFSKTNGLVDMIFMTPTNSDNTMCSYDKLNALAKLLTGGYELDTTNYNTSSSVEYTGYKMQSKYISKVASAKSNKFKNIAKSLSQVKGKVLDIQDILSPENMCG